ncbi:hypothetical protein G7047_00525 [Diaphorobacter sp. HDW4A]|uniref:hypothetical protein n=1 Tax=Diaphorobacter sp. HDW4A TaxID=2714924 RepID=UPI00140C89C0|nr:hypothetical protein [Diaphorobacter sp. HDW4A]QIL78571.1 hypothetical protein G7047_00525 [Diaphorobacter sp. HDW4A]
MKSMKLLGLVFSSVLLVACSQDVRDIKMSQITAEQKEQALKQMKPDDFQTVKAYQLGQFKGMPGTDVDRSFNEMIEFVNEEIKKEKSKK